MKLILENWKKFLKEGSTDSPDINDVAARVADYISDELIPSSDVTGDEVSDHYIKSITLDDIYDNGDPRLVGDLFDSTESTRLMALVNVLVDEKGDIYDR